MLDSARGKSIHIMTHINIHIKGKMHTTKYVVTLHGRLVGIHPKVEDNVFSLTFPLLPGFPPELPSPDAEVSVHTVHSSLHAQICNIQITMYLDVMTMSEKILTDILSVLLTSYNVSEV